jgi:hypothetical protein
MSVDEERAEVLCANFLEGTKVKVNTHLFDVSEQTVGPGYSGETKNVMTIKSEPASWGEKSSCASLTSATLKSSCASLTSGTLPDFDEAFNEAWASGREKMMKQRIENIAQCRRRDLELHSELNASFQEQLQHLMKEKNKVEMELELKSMECEEQTRKTEELENKLKHLTKKQLEKDSELEHMKEKLVQKENAMGETLGEMKRLGRLLKNGKIKNRDVANFIAQTTERLVPHTSRLLKAGMDNKQLHDMLAISSNFDEQLRGISLEIQKDCKLEIDLEVSYTYFEPFIRRKLSFTDSDSDANCIRKMVKIDMALLEKVKPIGFRRENEIDVFVRLMETSLVKDGVMLRLDITWDIMTLVRAGIAGWQWMLCNPDEETAELRALRENRRINWVMGVDTSNYCQVKSVAMLKFGLGVKFTGNHLSRKIQDYPELLKHNGKVWIISKDFVNVKPSSSSEIRYSERFWNRAQKSIENEVYKARVMPRSRSSLTVQRKARDRSNMRYKTYDSRSRQMSLEQKLSRTNSLPNIKLFDQYGNRSPHRQRKTWRDKVTGSTSRRLKRKSGVGEYMSMRADDSSPSIILQEYVEGSYKV